jgi:hypothetical protein
MAQYFYDAQIRRFILQFIRYFADYQVEYGKDANGNPIYLTVPVRYADNNRSVSAILKGNSENAVQNVPMMVVYIENLKYHRQHIQDPTFVEKINIRERAIDPLTGEIKTYQKNALTIERLMPVPYRLDLKLDIYTSNIEQKLQLFEQIAVMFNPSLEIQSTDNYLDWTSLSWIMLTDVNFSSKTIPQGVDETIDVATLTFEIPVYITAPAKVKKLDAVTAVVANIYDSNGNLSLAQSILDQYLVPGQRQWFTPSGYNTIVAGGQVVLSQNTLAGTNTATGVPVPANAPIPWRGVINYIGEITNGVSQMAFVNDVNGNTVIGTISYDPTDDSVLLFNVDPATKPSNTLAQVSHIIDPQTAGPGINLPAPAAGQRYLLINNPISSTTNAPTNGPSAWANTDGTVTVANANDIVEYDGANWNVVFNSQLVVDEEYVTNLYTNVQYKWSNGIWQKSWEGLYKEGYWLLII